MEDWQERLLTEQQELTVKIKKLATVILDVHFQNGITLRERELMRAQLEAMYQYDYVLQERILTFI